MKSLLAYWLILFLGRTQRWRLRDPNGIAESRDSQRYIFAFWHNRLALMPYFYTRRAKRGKAAVMISASRDGSFLTEILKRFGIEAVRGSSSRGGTAALRGLAEKLEQGYDAVIAPDGPRGPRYKAQAGVISLARLTGVPIVPAAYDSGWKIQLWNWDGFIIPLPLSWCELRVGNPIHVARDADEETQTAATEELERQLLELGGTREETERLENSKSEIRNPRKG